MILEEIWECKVTYFLNKRKDPPISSVSCMHNDWFRNGVQIMLIER